MVVTSLCHAIAAVILCPLVNMNLCFVMVAVVASLLDYEIVSAAVAVSRTPLCQGQSS